MSSSRKSKNRINKLHGRALRIMCNAYKIFFSNLREQNCSFVVCHAKNLYDFLLWEKFNSIFFKAAIKTRNHQIVPAGFPRIIWEMLDPSMY